MHLVDSPSDFARDATDGFLAAYARYVQRVPDTWAVMRRGRPREGKVAVVVGGGSGHYPAFCGLVGAGMADAAVMGEVFTSPSAEQAYRTGRAVDAGAGVLFSYGNYAGDVLNFGAAQERLLLDGIDCRTVLVTDDVASASAQEAGRRRGVAGDFIVFKIAGAAAERGQRLDDVERLARHANARTFSFGAAFRGCTLPGAAEPLFTVAPDTIELGLGIHGEPGVATADRVDVNGLARHLVEPILCERPVGSSNRVAVLLNGLGGTKYEEMFLLFKHVGSLLGEAGLTLVQPEVGELVTSLDMAGVSVTVTWLDDELDELWAAPCDAPAFRRVQESAHATTASASARSGDEASLARAQTVEERATASDTSAEAYTGPGEPSTADANADLIRRALAAMLAAVEENEQLLGHLDAVAGDGDHGTAMVRGLRAACEASRRVPAGAQAVLDAAADAFADRGAGTSGILWGVMLHAIGQALGDGDQPDGGQVAQALASATRELARVGGASPGDKTMLDSLLPFQVELARAIDSGENVAAAWVGAAERATDAARRTSELVARLGRARPLGAKGLGTPDPGATSMALCLQAVGATLAAGPKSRAKG